MVNRITSAVSKIENQIAGRLERGETTAAALDELGRKLDLSITEWALFQDKKSLAFAGGRLTLDEAQVIYCALGASPADFNCQSIALKVVLTKTFAELFH